MDINGRPGVADERSHIVDWQADEVMGNGNESALLARVERKTPYTGKRDDLLVAAAIAGTWDMADKVKIIAPERLDSNARQINNLCDGKQNYSIYDELRLLPASASAINKLEKKI